MIKNVFFLLTTLLVALLLLHTYSEITGLLSPEVCAPGACQCYHIEQTEYGENHSIYEIEIGEGELGECWTYHLHEVIHEANLSILIFITSVALSFISLLAYLRDRRKKFIILFLAYLLFIAHYIITEVLLIDFVNVELSIVWHLTFAALLILALVYLTYPRKK